MAKSDASVAQLGRMPHPARPPKPLNTAAIERLALRYVERYATTRAKLAAYCTRKIRERGWEGAPFDAMALAERFAELGYVDDLLFAETKAAAMGRRGLGARRVGQALRMAGVRDAEAEAIAPAIAERRGDSAITFARRKRIGPFAAEAAERTKQEKQMAAMVRAGHAPDLARRIVRMAPGEDVSAITDLD
jgi:regulatory protein